MGSVIVLGLLLIAMWVFVVKPQQRRQRAHLAIVSSLEPDDDVITTSGMYGTITEIDGQTVTIEVSDGVEIRMARQAIMRKLDSPVDEPMDDERMGDEPMSAVGHDDGRVVGDHVADDVPDTAD
jgi:preprotein translocase subunit YajC